jgi:hypothetical protein
MNDEGRAPRDPTLRARNRRMGLILATIALVFFIGVILEHTLGHH